MSEAEAKLVLLDDMSCCAELIFEYDNPTDQDVPFERLRFGNVYEMIDQLGDQNIKNMCERVGADRGYIQNMYVQGRVTGGSHRVEMRIGNQPDVDMEGFLYIKEGDGEDGNG